MYGHALGRRRHMLSANISYLSALYTYARTHTARRTLRSLFPVPSRTITTRIPQCGLPLSPAAPTFPVSRSAPDGAQSEFRGGGCVYSSRHSFTLHQTNVGTPEMSRSLSPLESSRLSSPKPATSSGTPRLLRVAPR